MPQTALTAGKTFISKQCPKQCPPNNCLLYGETGPLVCSRRTCRLFAF